MVHAADKGVWQFRVEHHVDSLALVGEYYFVGNFLHLEPRVGAFLRIEVVEEVQLELRVRVEYLQDFVESLFVTELVHPTFAEIQRVLDAFQLACYLVQTCHHLVFPLTPEVLLELILP